MANLKAIRDRIASVKNTKKITEAMRLVAAAKVRRAQEQVNATRPFADSLAEVLYNIQGKLKFEDVDLPLFQQREVKKVALLVVSGDRGLCGEPRDRTRPSPKGGEQGAAASGQRAALAGVCPGRSRRAGRGRWRATCRRT